MGQTVTGLPTKHPKTMNTVQDALNHLRKRKLTYWLVKSSNGKLKGEFEGEDLEESLQEFSELAEHLISGKYELSVRSGKQNYRGATVFDFEVYQMGNQQIKQLTNTSTMDANMFQVMLDIKTSLVEIRMLIQQNKEHSDTKFKELAKALSSVFDEDTDKKPLSPIEMLQGLKGLNSSIADLKL